MLPPPPAAPATAVVATGVTHRFAAEEGPLTVLDELDLEIRAGEYVALTGQSGSGKSTLLSLLGGLERPQAGGLVVEGRDLGTLRGDGLAAFRRDVVGFVFQHFGLLETLTAAENVELAGTLARLGPRERRRRADELLEVVGLGPRSGHRPGQLSGGERQRVAIARALVNRPQLVLADEPTGNLDEDASLAVVELLETLPRSRGCTLVVVTHNRALAARADRCLALTGGRVRAA